MKCEICKNDIKVSESYTRNKDKYYHYKCKNETNTTLVPLTDREKNVFGEFLVRIAQNLNNEDALIAESLLRAIKYN